MGTAQNQNALQILQKSDANSGISKVVTPRLPAPNVIDYEEKNEEE